MSDSEQRTRATTGQLAGLRGEGGFRANLGEGA